MKITFFGGVEEVTGSRYLVEHEGTKILVDCGLFQGGFEQEKRNWVPFPMEPSSIDAVVLTHAHIDHTGYLPAFVKSGFNGAIYCSKGTYELSAIMLIDSANLMQENAKNKNKEGKIASPLYTVKDAEHALKFFRPVDFDKVLTIGSLQVTLICSEHILGSSFVILSDGKETLTFSGDLGRPDQILMKPVPHLEYTDYLVLESTYGDRLHATNDPIKELGKIVNQTMARGGVLVIPAFAVGRSQVILYCLYELKQNNQMPDVPVFLDSPMAISVTNLFCKFKDELKVPTSVCQAAFDIATYTTKMEQSKKIDRAKPPFIIVAGSGMATGGRVRDHFKHFISDPKNTVLFVGYQAGGTTGRALIKGAQEVEIDDKLYPVRAQIKKLDMFSAHADYNEILDWLSYFKNVPKKVFLTHGELESAQALKQKIEERFGWSVVIPAYSESFELD